MQTWGCWLDEKSGQVSLFPNARLEKMTDDSVLELFSSHTDSQSCSQAFPWTVLLMVQPQAHKDLVSHMGAVRGYHLPLSLCF